MGGQSRQKQFDAKQNRLCGTNTDTRSKHKDRVDASTATWQSKNRSKDVQQKFAHRIGAKNKPYRGLAYTNPALAVHRAKTGYDKESKFNTNVGLPVKQFKTFNRRFETSAVISRVTGHMSRDLGISPSDLNQFIQLFLGKGLAYLKLSNGVRDGEILEEFVVQRFLDNFASFFSERMTLLNSITFWKQLCKVIGNFVCPQNTVTIFGEETKVHSIPARNLRKASISKIWSDMRKHNEKSEVLESGVARPTTEARCLKGGGKYGFYSVLSDDSDELKGGAGGNQNVFKSASTVRHKGSGSKSKQNKPIGNPNAEDPDPECTGSVKPSSSKRKRTESGSEGSVEPDEHFGCVDDIIASYISSNSGSAAFHDSMFVESEIEVLIRCVNQLRPGREVYLSEGVKRVLPFPVFDQDCGGAPFCGVTCVDNAARLKASAKKYASFIPQIKIRDQVTKQDKSYFTSDVIETVGTEKFLKDYCSSHGLGVCFLVNEGGNYHFHSLVNHRTMKFCVLINSNNHWTLLTKRSSNANHMYLTGDLLYPDHGCEYLGYGTSIKFGAIITRNDNHDVRSYINQREDIEVQGLKQFVTINKTFHVAQQKITIPFTNNTYLVDATRAHDMQNELALCNGDKTAVDALLGRLLLGRTINSAPDAVVVRDTSIVLRAIAAKVKSGRAEPTTRGLIMVNTPSMIARVPNLDVIAENQANGLLGGGSVNHVRIRRRKLKQHGLFRDSTYGDTWRDSEPAEKEVCVAPIGCPLDENIPVCSGLFSTTNDPGLVAGFTGRAMSKEEKRDPGLMLDYCTEAVEFITSLLDRTDVSVSPEDSSLAGMVAQFRKTNHSKKSAKWIDRKVNDYIKYKNGLMHAGGLRKYRRHSCFVKFESNIKTCSNGKVKVRPRLIMTMSDLMQFELCWMSNLANAWYDGPIAEYQVKHMNSDTMLSKIRYMQDRNHCVTDYSAFESSIGPAVRNIEMTLLRLLCIKAGYSYTLRMLNELDLDLSRLLVTKSFEFNISTRCSGDYWTSMGNGVVSITLMKFCHDRSDLKHLFFSMIAEGDDGCVPDGVPDEAILNKLGFKFSSEVKGSKAGDTDFLRSLWDHRRWLNIGRVLSSIFWVKKASRLRLSKQKFLLRTMALSLHHLSPGHPVLWAVVKNIEEETRGCTAFKSAKSFLDGWKEWDMSGSFPEILVDDTMRSRVAEGAAGIPGVPYFVQFQLERMILAGDYNFRGLLNDFDDFSDRVKASKPDRVDWSTTEMEEAYTIIGLQSPVVDLTRYRELGVVRKPSQRVTGERSSLRENKL